MKVSIELFVPDDKKGGKNMCNRTKNITHTSPYKKLLKFIF
ncbi:MAG: hypothetical protein ACFFDO_02540 [Candidatus Thorarchaeota archaeon]|jgi:hypothetical protein